MDQKSIIEVWAFFCLLRLAIGSSNQAEVTTIILKAEAHVPAIIGKELRLTTPNVPIKNCVWTFKGSGNSNVTCCYPENKCSKEKQSQSCRSGSNSPVVDEDGIGCNLRIPLMTSDDGGTYIMQSAEVNQEEDKVRKIGENLRLEAKGAEGMECKWLHQVGNQTCCYFANPWGGGGGVCGDKANTKECRQEEGNDSKRRYPKVTQKNDTCSLVAENGTSHDVGWWLGFPDARDKKPQAMYDVTYTIFYYVETVHCPFPWERPVAYTYFAITGVLLLIAGYFLYKHRSAVLSCCNKCTQLSRTKAKTEENQTPAQPQTETEMEERSTLVSKDQQNFQGDHQNT